MSRYHTSYPGATSNAPIPEDLRRYFGGADRLTWLSELVVDGKPISPEEVESDLRVMRWQLANNAGEPLDLRDDASAIWKRRLSALRGCGLPPAETKPIEDTIGKLPVFEAAAEPEVLDAVEPAESAEQLLPLSEAHLAKVESSGLTRETVRLAGLYTEPDPRKHYALVGHRYQGDVLVFPFVHPSTNEIIAHRVRPDKRRTLKSRDEGPKYDQRAGSGIHVYFGPRSLADNRYADVTRPCLATEGELKQLCLEQLGYPVMGLAGVTGWRNGKDDRDESDPLLLHKLIREHVAIKGREFVVVFDYDVLTNKNVSREGRKLADQLYALGATKVSLAHSDEKDLKGIDDYFAAKGEDATRALIANAKKYAVTKATRTLIECVAAANDGEDDDITPTRYELLVGDQFTDAYHEHLKYNGAFGWHVWTGTHWAPDSTEVAREHAKTFLRKFANRKTADPDEARLQAALARSRGIEAMLSIARSDSRIAFGVDAINQDPWLLNTKNGTIELKTGHLREHRREDMITSVVDVDYDPNAPSPLWDAFLQQVQPDIEVREYLARLIGLAAIGMVLDHVFPIFWGSGRNGKGAFVGAIQHVLGHYARSGPTSLIERVTIEPHSSDRVRALHGARLTIVSETEDSMRLSSAKVKSLTGGDQQNGALKGKDAFTWTPTHLLLLVTNPKPKADAADLALWSRVNLVPWTVFIAEENRDPQLPLKLQAEAAGILAWIIRGCLDYQHQGLNPPKVIRDQTAEYRAGEDQIGRFLVEAGIVRNTNVKSESAALYKCYCDWAENNGENAVSNKRFSQDLERAGHAKKKDGKVFWLGLGIPSRQIIGENDRG